MIEKNVQELVGLSTRVQFCNYCYSRVVVIKDLVLSAPENQSKAQGALGLLATFYMWNYYSNLSELFTKLKDDGDLEKLLKTTPEQRLILREKVRHVVVHSVNAEEMINAFNDYGDGRFDALWSVELATVTKYIYGQLANFSQLYAESFKQELLDVDDYARVDEQKISLKRLMDEAFESQKKLLKKYDDRI